MFIVKYVTILYHVYIIIYLYLYNRFSCVKNNEVGKIVRILKSTKIINIIIGYNFISNS